MRIFLDLSYLFCFGSMLGYAIEVVFRRFFSAHRWTNPGFLYGPFLPLYGFGLLFLYGVCSLPINLSPEWLKATVIIIILGLGMTLVEYIAGLIFIKGMNVKLWDYSKMRGNIQGIICPLFSLFWLILGAAYYFLIHPYITSALDWFNANVYYASYWLGAAYGFLCFDLICSFNLVSKISKAAKNSKILVSYEQYKLSAADARRKRTSQFLNNNPGFKEFIEVQKRRSSELIGRIAFKDEAASEVKKADKATQEERKRNEILSKKDLEMELDAAKNPSSREINKK